jgi:hypothetical protein
MKLSSLSLIIAAIGICSCSTQRKAQTTDDVYYSSGSNGGYVATDGSDDRVAANTQTSDNYNNYAYGNDGYAPFSTYSAYPYMGYGMGMGMGFGYGFGYSPWASPFYSPYFAYGYYPYPLYSPYYPMYYGGYYNPYYPGFGYYSKVGITSTGTLPLAPGRINTMAYNNNHFNNINSTVTRVGNITRPVAASSFAANNNKFARVATPTSNTTWHTYRSTVQGSSTRNNFRSSSSSPSYHPAGGGSFGRTGSFGGGGGGHMGGGGGRH